jgi:hypothetical protein
MSSRVRTPSPGDRPVHTSVVAVPRIWLIILGLLVVTPWLVIGGVYVWRQGVSARSSATAETRSTGQDQQAMVAGPWGTLILSPIVISPPIELLQNDWAREPDAGKWWFMPATRPEEADALLSSIGLSREQVSQLMSTAQAAPQIRGLVLTPDQDLVRGLAPDVRARLYVQLAKSALNADQANAFRYAGDSIDAWLGSSAISPATRRLVEPLIYRYGRHLYFADAALVRSQITDLDELRHLAKALLRQTTLRVRLSIPQLSDVPALADYWGRGGRRTDIRPLLESIVGAGADRSLDIVHLLPSFARERLYRYPRLTAQDLDRSTLANCLWTALNFFSDRPDDRYLDIDFAAERLKQDYYVIDNSFEFGDVVAMLDETGTLFHAAVYLADNLVFTKNGMSRVAPWVILPIDVVKDFYRPRCANPRLIYHRRKDF